MTRVNVKRLGNLDGIIYILFLINMPSGGWACWCVHELDNSTKSQQVGCTQLMQKIVVRRVKGVAQLVIFTSYFVSNIVC